MPLPILLLRKRKLRHSLGRPSRSDFVQLQFVGGDSNMGLFGKKKDEFIKIKVENLIDWKEPNGEGCIVSDKITKEGYKVGYMYREQPDEGRPDSGWRFMAGNEDDEYMNNPNNHHIFAVNTICNYDKDIIPYLHSEIGSTYIRVDSNKMKIDDGTKPIFIEKQN